MIGTLPARLLLVAVTLMALAVQGCGKGHAPAPAEKAEAAVEKFLESWSKGESPDKFAAAHPGISASDPDQQAGYRLLSFLSVETKQRQEGSSNLRCRFALSLRDPKGHVVDKQVEYEVALGEKCVIHRAQR